MAGIKRFLPAGVKVIAQGSYVAASLKEYLHRHPEMEQRCARNGTVRYFTTESPEKFKQQASLFLNEQVDAKKATLIKKS